MAISLYTSYDDIRAALGVSNDEIEDTTLSLPLYEYNLIAELSEVGAAVSSTYLGLPSSGLSDLQDTFKRAVHMFATYAVAKQLTGSLPLFSPKEIADGKSHLTRYAQDPYKVTIDAVNGHYDSWKARLIEAYDGVNATPVAVRPVRTYFTSAPRATDPVTGV